MEKQDQPEKIVEIEETAPQPNPQHGEGLEEMVEITPEGFNDIQGGECDLEEENNDESIGTLGDKMELVEDESFNSQNIPQFTKRIVTEFSDNADSIIAFVKYGNRIAYGGIDDTLTVVDTEHKTVLHKQKYEETVSFIELNFDQTLIALGTLDNKIFVINSGDFKEVSKIELDAKNEEITSLCFHPKGNILVIGFMNGTIQMFKIPSGQELMQFYGHLEQITDVQFSLNGKSLISSSMDGSVRTWNPKNGTEKAKVEGFGFHEGGVICFRQHTDPKKKILVTAGGDNSVCLSSYESGKIFQRYTEFESPITTIGISDAWNVCLVATIKGTMTTLDLDSFKVISSLKEETGIIHVEYADNLKYFIASTVNGKFILHAYGRSGIVKRYQVHESEIHAFKLEGTLLYSCGEDKRVVVTELPQI